MDNLTLYEVYIKYCSPIRTGILMLPVENWIRAYMSSQAIHNLLKKRKPICKNLLFVLSFILFAVIIAVIFCFWMTPTPPTISVDTRPFKSLQSRLVDDGFDAAMLSALFGNPVVHFEPRTTVLLFMHSEARINYEQFLFSESLHSARKYIQDHLSDFNSAEETFGVNKEVITAIMLVETRLGKYLGTSSILNTLSSLAVLKDLELRQIVWNSIPPDRRPDKSVFEEKADAKSAWAYQELKAFLIYTGREKIDPTSVYGSYAGAMGIPQFMPSNILTYARGG